MADVWKKLWPFRVVIFSSALISAEAKEFCQELKYWCKDGHCCGQGKCCTYYYELWWFWIVWLAIAVGGFCCFYQKKLKKKRPRRRSRHRSQSSSSASSSRQQEDSATNQEEGRSRRGTSGQNFPPPIVNPDKVFKLPSYDEVKDLPLRPPPYCQIFGSNGALPETEIPDTPAAVPSTIVAAGLATTSPCPRPVENPTDNPPGYSSLPLPPYNPSSQGGDGAATHSSGLPSSIVSTTPAARELALQSFIVIHSGRKESQDSLPTDPCSSCHAAATEADVAPLLDNEQLDTILCQEDDGDRAHLASCRTVPREPEEPSHVSISLPDSPPLDVIPNESRNISHDSSAMPRNCAGQKQGTDGSDTALLLENEDFE